MVKRSMVELDEDNEEEEQSRQYSCWTCEEEILICHCWIETSENNNIQNDRNEDSFWGKIMQDFNNCTYQASSVYEAKKEKELAYTECKELEFLMIDPDSLPKLKENIMAKYNQV
ncbi:hypothetical protein Tco_0897902 [Tanacetum coccineum]